MANRQYIGARYVPKFYEGSNGNKWDSGVAYEPLTVVTYLSDSYTSKKPVPNSVGNPANNEEYWAHTGAYNAQVEQYRSELLEFMDDVNDELDSLYNTENYAEKVDVYVDGVNGLDDNDGDEDAPYQTIDKALENFNEGVSSLYIHIVEAGVYRITKTEINGVVLHIYGVDGVVINWNSGLAGKCYNSHINIQCVDSDGEVEIKSPYFVASTFASWYCENCAVTLTRVRLSTYFTLFGCSFILQDCKLNATRIYWSNGTFNNTTFINNSSEYPAIEILNESNITFRGTTKHDNTLTEDNSSGFISCNRSMVRFATAFEENNYNTLAHKYANGLIGFNCYIQISENNLNVVLPEYSRNGNDYTQFTIFLFANIIVNDEIRDANPYTMSVNSIPANADLNDYINAGKYFALDNTISETIVNTPYTSSGFKLSVSYLSQRRHIRQVLEGVNNHGFFVRDIVLDESLAIESVSSWYNITGTEVT